MKRTTAWISMLAVCAGLAGCRDTSAAPARPGQQLLSRTRAALVAESKDELGAQLTAVEEQYPLAALYLALTDAEVALRTSDGPEYVGPVTATGVGLLESARISQGALDDARVTKIVECLRRGPRPDAGPGREGEKTHEWLERCFE